MRDENMQKPLSRLDYETLKLALTRNRSIAKILCSISASVVEDSRMLRAVVRQSREERASFRQKKEQG